MDGTAVARDCHTAGIALSAVGVVSDGMRVKHRLRGGESAFSVLARAANCGLAAQQAGQRVAAGRPRAAGCVAPPGPEHSTRSRARVRAVRTGGRSPRA
ncbi:hypothetical protein ACFWI5_35975, partial [Streptomyces sp. NPDC127064]|uniref:hypothetical protein n=1 Tax=Streptomyces sp. NPDC127064 TaxID=3347124 RepID=UPI00365E5872